MKTFLVFLGVFVLMFFVARNGGKPLTKEQRNKSKKDNSIVNDSNLGSYVD
jgi:hypothetical protein